MLLHAHHDAPLRMFKLNHDMHEEESLTKDCSAVLDGSMVWIVYMIQTPALRRRQRQHP